MMPVTEHSHVMLRISKKKINCPGFATLFFNHAIDFKPGQFIMVWIPGVDEKPYTISFHSKKEFGITIEAKGIFSRQAIAMEAGDIIGIRGPFGNGFEIVSSFSSIAVVAGGCGMAPLATLIEKLGNSLFFIHGARSQQFILYPDRFGVKRHICTDDGSTGHQGFVTDLLEKKIESMQKNRDKLFDMVYACGPEIMMYRVFKICDIHNIPCQISLERYMRCGFGVCGACVCGKQVVCRDGPVFDSDTLRDMTDFNRKALLKSGKIVELDKYVSWRSQ